MAIPIKFKPMSFTPDKPYAKRATAKMKEAAEKALKGATDFELVAPDKAGYMADITLSEILITDKSVTCNFIGALSNPAGLAFGFRLSGHSAVAPSNDEAGDVLFIIDDAVPKMVTARVLPAIKDDVAKAGSGGGAPKTGGSKPTPGKR